MADESSIFLPKLRRPANEEEYQRKRIGVEAETGSDRRGGLGGPIQPLLCVLNGEGEVLEEGRVRTSEEAFRRPWEAEPRQRIVMETGTHSPWISRLLRGFGHQVIVANARKVRAISENESKNDRQDAEMLARLGYCNPRLLKPIQHRSPEPQRELNLIRARDTLVRARTMLINTMRGLVKSAGGRLPPASSESFAARVSAAVAARVGSGAPPLLGPIVGLTAEVRDVDQVVENLTQR